MPLIAIPFDYDPQRYGKSLVPIYLNDTDDNGDTIFFGWIEAVIPIQDKLRALSRRVLGDVWRVSELTEISVHYLWGRFGTDLGFAPSHRIYATAHRKAYALEDPGARVHLGLNRSLDALDEYRKDCLLEDTADTERTLIRNLDVQRFEGKIRDGAKRNELQSFMKYKAGYDWKEIGEQLGENPNTVHRRFRRLLRKISCL